MAKKLILKCPYCQQILYELEECESFVAAGACMYCKGLLVFNPKTSEFDKSAES